MFTREKAQSVRIQVVVRPEDRDEIQAAAAAENLTMSEYIRQAIKFYYEATHKERRHINDSNSAKN